MLSDSEYRLRKEKTDSLVEGYRRVRERSLSPRDSPSGHKPVPDDLEPPPSTLGDGEDDSGSKDGPGIELGRDEANDQRDGGSSPVSQPGASTRAVGSKEDECEDGGQMKLEDACIAVAIRGRRAGQDESGKAVRVILTVRQLRRVMAARESLFKFGTFVPRSEREADASPEAPRWRAGCDLEWLRLGEQDTFERDWTWARIQSEHPTYKKTDIGFLFYVYNYKFSGEHRVPLVFDGSRQSSDTYDETYAPTARQESVRIFHVVCVEESYGIGQYDVPQAFLKAFIDFVIFVNPPRGQAEFNR